MIDMWLFKTEPSAYSYDRLEQEGETVWDGVTNPVALKNLRAAKVGDHIILYHTGDEKAAVGMAEVTRAAYPDPKADNPKQVVVDIKPTKRLDRPVSLETLKAMEIFSESPLVRQGRLSVVPITAAQWKAIQGQSRHTR